MHQAALGIQEQPRSSMEETAQGSSRIAAAPQSPPDPQPRLGAQSIPGTSNSLVRAMELSRRDLGWAGIP